MLRKRTSFKPNLKQVSTQQQQQPTPPTTSQPAASAPAPPASEQDEFKDTKQVGDSQPTHPPVPKVDDISNQRVQEAITQLTGQKFEPIKLLSLRSSVNKNVKLKDLLFFNPPMTRDQRRHKRTIHLARKKLVADARDKATTDSNNGDSTKLKTPEEHSLIPKVKVGPEGKLILDESSTIINRKNSIKAQEAIVEDHEDVISKTNYESFRRKPPGSFQTKWSMEDTKKFYHALTILGTDFSMMESLLFSGHRNRTELHKKFKREERVNKVKVDIALANRITLTSEELDGLKEVFYT